MNETPIVLVDDDDAQGEYAVEALRRVGLDDVRGRLDGGFAAWRLAGLPTRRTTARSAQEVGRDLAAGARMNILDVRTDREWEAGHIEGAVNIHGGLLADRLDEVPAGDAALGVVCDGAYRSTVAASVLERAGRDNVVNITGGMRAWRAAGLPVTRAGLEVPT